MSTLALWDLLPDFGPAKGQAEAPAHAAPMHRPAEPDIGTLIAEAVANAEAELEARLAEAHAAQLAAVQEAAANESRAFMETLGADIGERIAARMDQLQEQVSQAIGAAAARTIGGLLSDALRERSLAALAESIGAALDDAEAIRIQVRGPAHLYEKLAVMLGDRTKNLDFSEAPGFDLTVSIDETVIETRMSEWSTALSEMLS